MTETDKKYKNSLTDRFLALMAPTSPNHCSTSWCKYNHPVFKKECKKFTHVCDEGSSLYTFLRFLFTDPQPIEDHGGLYLFTHKFSNENHTIAITTDFTFAIHGPHLKGVVTMSDNPFFCQLFQNLLYRLAKTNKYTNANNLAKLLPDLQEKPIVPPNDDTDEMLIVFWSVLDHTYQKDDEYVYTTTINVAKMDEEIWFRSGDDLKFRHCSYVYFIRSIFLTLLESIGKIENKVA